MTGWLTEWVNAGKRHWVGGRGLLHRRLRCSWGKQETFSTPSGPSVPIATSTGPPSPWRIQGHFINEARQSYLGSDCEENTEHSFLVLFCRRVDCWGGWAEGEERRKHWAWLKFPNSLQLPHRNWVWPPNLLEGSQKNPRTLLFPFKDHIELRRLAPRTLFLTL